HRLAGHRFFCRTQHYQPLDRILAGVLRRRYASGALPDTLAAARLRKRPTHSAHRGCRGNMQLLDRREHQTEVSSLMPNQPQMHGVTFKNTGHMLGILTRSADVGGALDPTAAVPNGAQMAGPFRGNSTTPLARTPSLLVPVDQIGIVSSKILRPLLLHP